MEYKDWLKYQSNLAKRDVSKDENDYDLESYYNSLKANPMDQGHLPDTFKKPNHPTFSNQSMYSIPGVQEGGSWNQDGTEFTPSEVNMRNMGLRNLENYFNEVEPNAKLNLPEKDKFSKIKNKVNKS